MLARISVKKGTQLNSLLLSLLTTEGVQTCSFSYDARNSIPAAQSDQSSTYSVAHLQSAATVNPFASVRHLSIQLPNSTSMHRYCEARLKLSLSTEMLQLWRNRIQSRPIEMFSDQIVATMSMLPHLTSISIGDDDILDSTSCFVAIKAWALGYNRWRLHRFIIWNYI